MRPPALATTCLRSAPPHHLSLDAPPTFAKAGTHNLGIGACRHVFQVTPTLVSIYLLGLCHGAWRRATLMYHTYSNTAHRTRGTAGEGSLRTHTDEDILNQQAPFVVGSRPHSQIRTHPYLLRGKFDLWRSGRQPSSMATPILALPRRGRVSIGQDARVTDIQIFPRRRDAGRNGNRSLDDSPC